MANLDVLSPTRFDARQNAGLDRTALTELLHRELSNAGFESFLHQYRSAAQKYLHSLELPVYPCTGDSISHKEIHQECGRNT